METILKQFKQILITVLLMLFIVPAIAQPKHTRQLKTKPVVVSRQLADFNRLVAQANISFTFPAGFKEINAPNNEDFSFDYAMELPGKEFEIWFHIKPEKEDWASYVYGLNNPNAQLANPDSLYKDMGAAQAIAFTGEKNSPVRVLPQHVLARYNADAGRSYMLTLLDLPETKHFKYALLITLHKNHTGTIIAVCFTNDKGPEFFKNMNDASNCIKFKPSI
ncbi:MAG: hypothetical protein JWP44_1443 [Mucilaginibacter sp.]|nr:hypothetical protein [Mucilaginibacter sp.]